ncbi:MAG: pantoate--beta-alanine ligase [Flavobacteriales bacterium]|nr:pantoate--beta-alanine ligase [Flavobacteriales bacterium]
MHIFYSKKEIFDYILLEKSKKSSIGFVPTMGALHDGHMSLVEGSKKENNITVVSIFVNPTQFDNPDDLIKYPITTNNDIALLKQHDVEVVFIPNIEEIYGSNVISEEYSFGNLDKVMEGEHRKGHFDGVATIVKLLFDTVMPDNAYFGEKDFQQLQIIKKMVEIKKLDVNIVACPIVREDDGLAMSSRNVRLTEEHRKEAPIIYKCLKEVSELAKTKSVEELYAFVNELFNNNDLLELEYFEIREINNLSKVTDFQLHNEYRAFIAVFAQNIRLIDNIRLF